MNQTARSEVRVTATQPVKAVRPSLAFVMSTRSSLVFVYMILIFMIAARSIVDPDFWWHLKAGEYIFLTRSIPFVDIFSSTFIGKEWVAHEWLSELFIFATYNWLGFGGLIVTFALIITATFWIIYKRISPRFRQPVLLGPALLLGALASAPTWGVRPQMFSFLLASVFIALLESYARKPDVRKILWLVPLMVLWVNLHAGYAMGIAFIGLMIVGLFLERALKANRQWGKIWHSLYPLCGVLLLCVLAVLVNPNGARLFAYPFETLKSPAMMRYIEEWHSPNFHQLMFQPLAWLFLGVVASIALSRRGIRLRDLLFLIATGWATLKSARNVPFFVLIALPILIEHCYYALKSSRWASWVTKRETTEIGASALLKIALNVVLLIATPLALAVQRVNRSTASQAAVTAEVYPVKAVDYMRANKLPQPVYNTYSWGGYLIWHLYPDYLVHIDGRADVYGDAFVEQFLKAHAGEGDWQGHLERNNVQTVVVRADAPIANLLRGKTEWKQVFNDSQAAIFVRQPAAP